MPITFGNFRDIFQVQNKWQTNIIPRLKVQNKKCVNHVNIYLCVTVSIYTRSINDDMYILCFHKTTNTYIVALIVC